MTATGLVLSVFPGIDLLGRAFEEEGYCVVRGPDLLWGGDVRIFRPPTGVFEGVIGGPPCQAFSSLAAINVAQGRSPAENLIPEFERIVDDARPRWFFMENVRRAPVPEVPGYSIDSLLFNNRWLGEKQTRLRRLSFGSNAGTVALDLEVTALESCEYEFAVTATSGGRRAFAVRDRNGGVRGKQGASDWARLRKRSIEELCELQGLPMGLLANAPFTKHGKRQVIANGVPMAMGRAVAAAVRRATACPP